MQPCSIAFTFEPFFKMRSATVCPLPKHVDSKFKGKNSSEGSVHLQAMQGSDRGSHRWGKSPDELGGVCEECTAVTVQGLSL